MLLVLGMAIVGAGRRGLQVVAGMERAGAVVGGEVLSLLSVGLWVEPVF